MWSALLGILSGGLALINKLLPSWEWKGGQAAAQRDQMEETLETIKKMDDVPMADERDTVDRLRNGKF